MIFGFELYVVTDDDGAGLVMYDCDFIANCNLFCSMFGPSAFGSGLGFQSVGDHFH